MTKRRLTPEEAPDGQKDRKVPSLYIRIMVFPQEQYTMLMKSEERCHGRLFEAMGWTLGRKGISVLSLALCTE